MGRFLAISIALHAMILLVEARRARVAVRATLSVEVREREAPPEKKLAMRGGGGGGGRGGGGKTRGRAAIQESAPPQTPGEAAAVERGGGSVELFPSGVLQKFGAAEPGPPARKQADEEGASEKQVVGERVRGWLEAAAGGERARTLVAPEWRDFERRLVQSFRPPRKLVEEKLTPGTWARQLLGQAPESPPLHPSLDDGARQPRNLENNASSVMEQMAAARAAYRRPRQWWRVEIELGVDAAGVVRARVVSSSGKRALDRHALGAVEGAAAGKLEPGVTTRWRCEAAIAVDPVPQPVLGFSFDESLRTIKPDAPMIPEVQTRVTLIEISRR